MPQINVTAPGGQPRALDVRCEPETMSEFYARLGLPYQPNPADDGLFVVQQPRADVPPGIGDVATDQAGKNYTVDATGEFKDNQMPTDRWIRLKELPPAKPQ